MSPTRLLILGAVRIFQPVHGYDVRRELLSWHVEESANIAPGSIYSALKTLHREGLIAGTARSGEDHRPARTEYVLTGEGEKAFAALLRSAWWRVEEPAEPLIPALCLLPHMPRAELIEALRSRIGQLEGRIAEMGFLRGTIRDGATGADGGIPDHVREVLDFQRARLGAELGWARQFLGRLRAGEYRFADEPGVEVHGVRKPLA